MTEGVVIIWLLCALIGLLIGQSKGRAAEGFVLGLLLGLIGVVIIAVVKPVEGQSSAPTIARQPIPASLAPGQSLTEALAELESLRADGIIDAEEFTAAKRRLLGL